MFLRTDYFNCDDPLVCWTYTLPEDKALRASEAPWSMAPVVLQMCRALFAAGQGNVSFSVWAQYDVLHQEYLLGIAETIARGPIGPLLRKHLGGAKGKQPGLALHLIQAPSRIPQLLNRHMIPILRFQEGWVVNYGASQPLLLNHYDPIARLSSVYRRWARTDSGSPEQYQPVPHPARALEPGDESIEIGPARSFTRYPPLTGILRGGLYLPLFTIPSEATYLEELSNDARQRSLR